MIIYNVTVQVHPETAAEWVAWMREVHMPALLATGCFQRCQLSRLLEQDETDGITYSAQYYAADMNRYERYISDYAPAFREETKAKFADRFVAFRSLMEVVG